MVVILGAGLSGLSSSYHIGHEKCLILEKKSHVGGHANSKKKYGMFWDEGPHVSFTKSNYVREIFGYPGKEINKIPVKILNYFEKHWLNHPANINLQPLNETFKKKLLKDFIYSKSKNKKKSNNYEEWLVNNFGELYTKEFPLKYTKKYWTVEPNKLNLDWVGKRITVSSFDTMIESLTSKKSKFKHYFNEIIYPKNRGFIHFSKKIKEGANVQLNSSIKKISLDKKIIYLNDNKKITFEKLINTIPLPDFISLIEEAPKFIKDLSSKLNYTSVIIVNIVSDRPMKDFCHWFYLYDESFYTARVTSYDNLNCLNQSDKGFFQAEIYHSSSKTINMDVEKLRIKVIEELRNIKIFNKVFNSFTQSIKYANIIFDHDRVGNLEKIYSWLENHGLIREENEFDANLNLDVKQSKNINLGGLILAGRYAQWNYFWSDDCILRGKFIGENI